MTPRLRPKRSIVLINRHPTALYSGMVPGLIAGIYRRDELSINLPHLCDRAGVAFVQAEISGIDSQRQDLLLHQRPALSFGVLSLDVGAVTRNLEHLSGVPIKPLEEALQFLSQQDPEDPQPFRIVGAGPAGIEVALALRRRWPRRHWNYRSVQANSTPPPSRSSVALTFTASPTPVPTPPSSAREVAHRLGWPTVDLLWITTDGF
jgi:selenide,water dikinase